jgi:1,4-alpha-glucan branching enzyme
MDNRALHEPYGSMEDWDEMLKTCHDHGIKLVHDLVVNHCSSEVCRPSSAAEMRLGEIKDFPDVY